MTSILVKDGNGSEQTVVLTLPGVAGTASADVLSIQGVASMTPVAVSGAVTISGTANVSAAQSGTWNITNISGTVSLPTGAATAAKQPAFGVAGTAAADVITVQGINSMTPLSSNTTQIGGNAIATGNGVVGTGVQRVAIASDNTAFSVNSTPIASEVHLGEVGGNSALITATTTRPNDTNAYAIGDLIANSTAAGLVTPITLMVSRKNDGVVVIPRIRLKKSSISLTSATFRIHFYKSSPTCTNGDNGAWLTTESNYIGYMDIVMDRVFSDAAIGFGIPAVGGQLIAEPDPGTKNIYALIEARAAYTPVANEVFTVTAECLRD